MITSEGYSTNLAATDMVVLYPTFGYPVEGERAWRIQVRGAVYELGQVKLRERLLIRMLQRVMKVSADALDSDIFRDRIQDFTWVTERGKRVAIRLGEQVYRLPKPSQRNGHFSGSLRVSQEEMERLRSSGQCQRDWLQFEVLAPGEGVSQPQIVSSTDSTEPPRAGAAGAGAAGAGAAGCQDTGVTVTGVTDTGVTVRPVVKSVGRARLLGQRGLSVISDIDDTLRHSEVACRRSLLANTFLREFSSVGGMVDLYREWEGQGAVFHYVSSSPWQLYRPLLDMWQQEGIPEGTFHLRLFRLRDHMLRRLLLLRSGKGAAIHSILASLPQRRFVLVGDSGERDPEIYAAMARKFRDRVQAVFIRQVPSRPMDPGRCRRVFRHLSRSSWHLFHEPGELRDRLPASDVALHEWGGTSPRARQIHLPEDPLPKA